MNEYNSIKSRIFSYDPKKWWGDDNDVRFYLISKIMTLKNCKILDAGGGIGIISAELSKNNHRINLDLNLDDLKFCKKKVDSEIELINGWNTNLPFHEKSFDCIISSSVLQYLKNHDLQKNMIKKENGVIVYPSVEKTLSEFYRILKSNGRLYLVTPNDAYYNSFMLSYEELKNALRRNFEDFSIFFYNTYPVLSKKFRKLNLSNTIPKLRSKFQDRDKITQSLIKRDQGKERHSVSFFVEVKK